MSEFNFVIPIQPDDLFDSTSGTYTVKTVLRKEEISQSLKDAQRYFRDIGPVSILENFDVYFGIIQLYNQVPQTILLQVYEDLKKHIEALKKLVTFLLNEEDSVPDEKKQEMQNIIKMLVYLFVSVIQALEECDADSSDLLIKKSRKKKLADKSAGIALNWLQVVETLKGLFELDLNSLWEAPGVDETLTSKALQICYMFLEKSEIKKEQATQSEIWTIFGIFINNYNVDSSLILRLVALVKEHEHASGVLAAGIKTLVNDFKLKSLLSTFVKDLTEWQIGDRNVDSNAAKYCTKMIVDLTCQLPVLMIPQIEYLKIYLKTDAHHLRNMVLSVQVEVLLSSLSKATLTDQERSLRNDILHRLERFTGDKSSFVRSKVFGHIARLQTETAIPLSMVNKYLSKAVHFLLDRTATVRKAAANCVTTMLKYNVFGPSLSLKKMQQRLEEHSAELMQLKYEMFGIDMAAQEEIEVEWKQHAAELEKVIKVMLEKEPDDECEEEEEEEDAEMEANKENDSGNSQARIEPTQTPPVDATQLVDNIRTAVRNKDYASAIRICSNASNRELLDAQRRRNETVEKADVYLLYIYFAFCRPTLNKECGPTEEQLTELSKLETTVDMSKISCTFCQLLDDARKLMVSQLLNSINISDMHESVEFIVTAYQFKLDNCIAGILEILKVMARNEDDRKKIVLEALKTVFLHTDSKSLEEHTCTIVEALIELLLLVSNQNFNSLRSLIADWAANGTLGNDVMDRLWKYFLCTQPNVSAKKSRAALGLLAMAAFGRRSIAEKNYHLVAEVCFGERGREDVLLGVEGARFLAVLASRPSITNNACAFRIPANDKMWTDLLDLLKSFFANSSPFVNNLISASVRLIFQLCAMPFPVVQHLLRSFLQSNESEGTTTTEKHVYHLVHFNVIVGEIILNFMLYLDKDVYLELKRREYMLNEQKNNRNGSRVDISASSTARSRNRQINTSSSSAAGADEESMMDGAEVIDEDAEMILNILEHRSISKGTLLGKCYERIVTICKQPNLYSNIIVQNSAITTLLRGMLISAEMCEAHIKLVFIILHKTTFIEVKLTILLHMADLLEKNPNIIEPYSSKLYALLDDSELPVREMTMKVLTTLILKDMIRPQNHIWRLARCTVDPNPCISEMAKSFFNTTAQKSTTLYNSLPDIFTHLCECIEDDEDLTASFKFLFGLIDKPKQIENLVDRFCNKYIGTSEDRIAQRITLALSLFNYNERALQKLIEHLPTFKHFVLVDGVFAHFKQLISNTLKEQNRNVEIKARVQELEALLNSMLDPEARPKVADVADNNFKKPKPVDSARKKRIGSQRGRARISSTRTGSKLNQSDDDASIIATTPSRTRRAR